jgi:hypothetical protein
MFHCLPQWSTKHVLYITNKFAKHAAPGDSSSELRLEK